MELNQQERRELLKDEYLFLQNQYEDIDRRTITIKGWIGTGAVTALAISLNSSQRISLFIPIIVIVVAAVFWYLEAYWRLFQYAFQDRIRVIEAYFRDDPNILIKSAPQPLQIYDFWFRSYREDKPIYESEKAFRPQTFNKRLWRAASHRYVYVLYVTIIGLSIASLIVIVVWNYGYGL